MTQGLIIPGLRVRVPADPLQGKDFGAPDEAPRSPAPATDPRGIPDPTRTRVRPCPATGVRVGAKQVTAGSTDNAGMPTPIRCALCLRVVQDGEAVRPCRSRDARYRARRRVHAACLRAAVLAPRGGR